MTRTGKIARLPCALRAQLNQRLKDGAKGRQLVAWLNAQGEVRAILQAEFEGHPITTQNLSEWKQGGFRDWLRREEALELVRHVAGEAAAIRAAAAGPITEHLALWVVAQYAVASRALFTGKAKGPNHWRRLREFNEDVGKLRRGDQEAERLKLIERQIKLNEQAEEAKGRRSLNALMETLFAGAKKNLTVGAALDVLAAALNEAGIRMGAAPAAHPVSVESDQIQPNPTSPAPASIPTPETSNAQS